MTPSQRPEAQNPRPQPTAANKSSEATNLNSHSAKGGQEQRTQHQPPTNHQDPKAFKGGAANSQRGHQKPLSHRNKQPTANHQEAKVKGQLAPRPKLFWIVRVTEEEVEQVGEPTL